MKELCLDKKRYPNRVFVVCGKIVSFVGEELKGRREGDTIKVHTGQVVATRKCTHKSALEL